MRNFLYKMQMKMSRMMYGRNGQDELSHGCFIAGLIMLFISLIFRQTWLYVISLAVWGYSIFRMFSRNIAKRQRENAWFLEKTGRVKGWFRFQKMKWKDRKVSRYYTCPDCKQKIRVPKGRGKIMISCPKCRGSFVRRT